MYYRFSFGEGLVFGFEDVVDSFEAFAGLCTFSGGNDFIVGVRARCGDYFLRISYSHNFLPAAINTVVF